MIFAVHTSLQLSWVIKDRNEIQCKLDSSTVQVEKLLDANISLQHQLQHNVNTTSTPHSMVTLLLSFYNMYCPLYF
jgi:hypothetical protein